MSVAAAAALGVFCYLAAGLVLGRLPRPHRWRRERSLVTAQQAWLAQAGAAVTPAQFWVASVLAALGAFTAGTFVTGSPVVAAVPALAVGALPRAYFGSRRTARSRALQEAWPDALRDLVASVAAGRSLGGALVELANTGPEPLRSAFGSFESRARMLGTVAALELIREEIADPTTDRVIEVLVLASERGGQIVKDVLEDLVVATTKDLKVLDEIHTEGLEMRINSRAVLVLPWIVLVALTVRGGAFREFYASGSGFLVVLAGGALSAVGYLWISHLGRSQEERRVFGGGRVGPVGGS